MRTRIFPGVDEASESPRTLKRGGDGPKLDAPLDVPLRDAQHAADAGRRGLERTTAPLPGRVIDGRCRQRRVELLLERPGRRLIVENGEVVERERRGDVACRIDGGGRKRGERERRRQGEDQNPTTEVRFES